MKKQAATTTGSGKGMMGVVLPMYAVGIVIYLIYTLTKVSHVLTQTYSLDQLKTGRCHIG